MKLNELRKSISEYQPEGKEKTCPGLPEHEIASFLKTSPQLSQAISLAAEVWSSLDDSIKKQAPAALLDYLQEHILNFYSADSRAPYVPLAAKGPWVITSEGSVIYESGGYGMLGFGHAPDEIQKELQKEDVMANVMTAGIAQKKASEALRAAIGIERKAGCPYSAFAFLNSGSEANNLAIRLADLHASRLIAAGKSKGKKPALLTLKKGFHGRTDAPARVSDSSIKSYKDLPMLGKQLEDVYKVEMNDVSGIKAAYDQAANENTFICAAIVEPVMGEGSAGFAMIPEFYAELRKVSKENESLLIIDSIQAGIRAHGFLSMVDYPGMTSFEAPDIETFSKAINGGQFPISVIALNEKVRSLSVSGPVVYGNTMTTNPKAMNIVCAVLKAVGPETRKNINDQGRYFLEKLKELPSRYPKIAESAQGTGLLISLRLKAEIPVEGPGGVEQKMRRAGVNVIHSAGNSLRFTPRFNVTREELDLVLRVLENILKNSPLA